MTVQSGDGRDSEEASFREPTGISIAVAIRCVDVNSATLIKRGVEIDKIFALAAWRDSPLFSPTERLALEYAEAMTVTGRTVSDDLSRALKNEWNDDTIVELTGLIAFQNLSSKFNAALDVPSQGFCLPQKAEVR